MLAPISRGNLTIFPVVADRTHDTQNFLTLDEGMRSGEVVVSEAGSVRPLVRGHERYIPSDGAEVNRLVLVNNSDRPLILLAGEIVTGGKQDRVVGKDRIVPAKSDPIDLSVFCVEPERWVAAKSHFGSFQFPNGAAQRAAQRHGRPKPAKGVVGSPLRIAVVGPGCQPSRRARHGTELPPMPE